ncbi:MAG: hypothetical protein IJ685_01515 [Selenomonadaceae bacterium]|nr:hypothetical protein [Selenomonadaceae bacterium]
MKQIFLAVTFAVMLIFAETCAAQDVWIEQRSNGVDVYVMDDTITSNISDGGRIFSVSVKEVKNGQLQRVINRDYLKYENDMWREHMKDHSVALHPVDKVFEFCMNQLGWAYRTGGNDPIVKFYY